MRKEKKLKGKKKNSNAPEEPHLTKSQKKSLKLKEKKLKKAKSTDDDFKKYDHVKFGDVVHAPPSLPLPKKQLPNEKSRVSLIFLCTDIYPTFI